MGGVMVWVPGWDMASLVWVEACSALAPALEPPPFLDAALNWLSLACCPGPVLLGMEPEIKQGLGPSGAGHHQKAPSA